MSAIISGPSSWVSSHFHQLLHHDLCRHRVNQIARFFFDPEAEGVRIEVIGCYGGRDHAAGELVALVGKFLEGLACPSRGIQTTYLLKLLDVGGPVGLRGRRPRSLQFLRLLHLPHEEQTLQEVEVLRPRGYPLVNRQPRLEIPRALIQARDEGVGHVPQGRELPVHPYRVETEYCLELALYVGGNGEEADLQCVLLVEGGFEIWDQDAD